MLLRYWIAIVCALLAACGGSGSISPAGASPPRPLTVPV